MKKILFTGITAIIFVSIVYLSLTSRNIGAHINHMDKFQHALAYGVLAYFFCMTLTSFGMRKRRIIVTLLFCALVGGSLEILQSRYGRMMDPVDFISDIFGASLSCSIISFRDHRAA
ncbi:MAG: VanZ family protein [Spirochaetaceae bacterium]|nr:VanZ family protein [Spirochaetaceae bacterium]